MPQYGDFWFTWDIEDAPPDLHPNAYTLYPDEFYIFKLRNEPGRYGPWNMTFSASKTFAATLLRGLTQQCVREGGLEPPQEQEEQLLAEPGNAGGIDAAAVRAFDEAMRVIQDMPQRDMPPQEWRPAQFIGFEGDGPVPDAPDPDGAEPF